MSQFESYVSLLILQDFSQVASLSFFTLNANVHLLTSGKSPGESKFLPVQTITFVYVWRGHMCGYLNEVIYTCTHYYWQLSCTVAWLGLHFCFHFNRAKSFRGGCFFSKLRHYKPIALKRFFVQRSRFWGLLANNHTFSDSCCRDNVDYWMLLQRRMKVWISNSNEVSFLKRYLNKFSYTAGGSTPTKGIFHSLMLHLLIVHDWSIKQSQIIINIHKANSYNLKSLYKICPITEEYQSMPSKQSLLC